MLLTHEPQSLGNGLKRKWMTNSITTEPRYILKLSYIQTEATYSYCHEVRNPYSGQQYYIKHTVEIIDTIDHIDDNSYLLSYVYGCTHLLK